jgi:hypothetical protein
MVRSPLPALVSVSSTLSISQNWGGSGWGGAGAAGTVVLCVPGEVPLSKVLRYSRMIALMVWSPLPLVARASRVPSVSQGRSGVPQAGQKRATMPGSWCPQAGQIVLPGYMAIAPYRYRCQERADTRFPAGEYH